jgi:transcriptional regulator with XRE-family HTH domain
VRIEDVIGYWITKGREETGMTQGQIGEELGRYLEKPWPRQAVSAAEKGRRSFTAAELVAFSAVLGCNVETLLQPPEGVTGITLGNEKTLNSRHLRTTVSTNTDLEELVRAVNDLRRQFPAVRAAAENLSEEVGAADDLLERAVRELWTATRGRGIDVQQEEVDAANAARQEKYARRAEGVWQLAAENAARRAAARQGGDQS